MAKAKKKRAAAKAAPAPAAVTAPGRKFATVKTVTLPVLALKIEVPAYVTFRGDPRGGSEAHMGAGDIPALAEVLDLDANDVKSLEMPAKLAAIFTANYGDGITGKSFCIIRHAKHDRKNEYGYTVEEIDPNKPAE